MTENQSQLISEVRTLTDYTEDVIPDSEMETLVQIAKSDIESITNNSNLEWYGSSDMDANRALMWTTCLFCKVKAGELDAAQMSLYEIDIQPLEAAGKENGSNPAMWYRKANTFVSNLEHLVEEDNPSFHFGHGNVSRENRVYEEDDSGGDILG